MDKVFEVDGTGVSHHSVKLASTGKNPTVMDYVKDELQILKFQPSSDMIFDLIGQKVDYLCGADKNLVDTQEEHGGFDSYISSGNCNSQNRVTPIRHNSINLGTQGPCVIDKRVMISEKQNVQDESKIISPPRFNRKRGDFKHVQLPHSVYLMAAAYDSIQRSKSVTAPIK